MTTTAVVGHCEWVTFAKVDHLPAPGTITTATDAWDEPAGGGAVAARVLHLLSPGHAHFFTALGTDATGERVRAALETLGPTLHASAWPGPHTTGFVHLEHSGERTITVMHRGPQPEGAAPLPWHLLDATDAVYFVKGDAAALRHARRARVLVATARVLPLLAQARIPVDALVYSAADPGERYQPGDLHPTPRLVVATEGAQGGRFALASGETGRYPAAPLSTPLRDCYGAGDSFAAGLAFALGQRLDVPAALALAARCGADALQRDGAHGKRGWRPAPDGASSDRP